MAQDLAPPLHEHLQRHVGIVSIANLLEAGWPRRDIYRLLDAGDFDLIMPGILRSRHWPVGPEQLMMAACLGNEHAVISSLTAARHWRFRGLPKDDAVHVVVPHSSSPTLPGVTVHRCRHLAPQDIVALDDGRRVTSPTRTLFDCADTLGVEGATSVLEQLIDDGKGTFATHAATLTRLAHPRRPGTKTMTHVIVSRPAWSRALQSELELRVLREIERQGLPAPEIQYGLTLPNGQRIRFDFAWPSRLAGLEVDHPFWHAGQRATHRDKGRDLVAATVGWQTMRITNLDVDGGLTRSIADVATVLSLR